MSDAPTEFVPEAERLASLRASGLFGTVPEPAYDDVARLAAELWEAPIALVTLVDAESIWFKAAHGTEGGTAMPRAGSFCQHTLGRSEPLVVEDATLDPRFANSELVTKPGGVRFYAGVPVGPAPGVTWGSLCILDTRPRRPGERELERLRLLGRQISNEMRLRLAACEQAANAQRMLRRLETRMWQQAETLPFIVWTATADGVVDYANRHLLDYAGVATDETLGENWVKVVHPEDLPGTLEAWGLAVREGSPYATYFRLRRRDGVFRWFQVQAAPIRDAEGVVSLWYGIAVDVEEQRRLVAEASRSERRLAATLDAITDGFFTLDEDWRFTHLNGAAERILHRSRSELLGRNIWEEFPEARGSAFERNYRTAREEVRALVFEAHYPPLAAWFEVRAFPSEDGLAVYFREVTERRQADQRLREQAALLNQTHDAILVRGLDNRIRYWNQGAERLYGWEAERALGAVAETLLYREPSEFRAAMQKTVEEGEWSGRLRQMTRDGRDITVEARWTLIRDEAGAPEAVMSINTDITERLKLEQQFLRAQRMESIGTLAGGIAHDLNNLLAPIMMGVDLLRATASGPQTGLVLDNIARSARRGSELVKQVLSFARGVEGARVSVRVGQLLRELEVILANTFPRDIRLECVAERGLWPVVGDPTQLHQVLLNICLNARDAMPAGGQLALTARNTELDKHYTVLNRGTAAGRYVVIEVSDDGEGMSEDVQARAFEPFFSTKQPGRGTGLGLSTALGIVRSHGGFVNLYSEVGKGSVFKVYLPAQADAEPEPKADSTPPLLPHGNGEWVLVVDDEASILTVTQQTLETFGYRVLTADDGAQAVGIYATRREEIAVILTDMMMPVMDGPALIAALRRLNPSVRIIAASGLNANGNLAKAANAGVRHFLSKPYSAERLLTTLRTVLAEPV